MAGSHMLPYQIFSPIGRPLLIRMCNLIMLVEAIMWFRRNATIANLTPNDEFGMIFTIMSDGQFTRFEFLLTIPNWAIISIRIIPFFDYIQTENFEAKNIIGLFFVDAIRSVSDLVFVDVVTFRRLFLHLQPKNDEKQNKQIKINKQMKPFFVWLFANINKFENVVFIVTLYNTYRMLSDKSVHCDVLWRLFVDFISSIFLDLLWEMIEIGFR